MKILLFKGTKINEYIDIEIDFNDDLSILVGTNGSGKTTSLHLIHSLLCPNLDQLIMIPFEEISLHISLPNKHLIIGAIKTNNSLKVSISNISETLEINNLNFDDYELLNYKSKEEITFSEFLSGKYFSHPVVEYIRDLPSPIFIGLERTNPDIKEDYKNYLLERNIFTTKSSRTIERYRKRSKGTLGVSILETELLIQSIYKRLKAVEDRYSSTIQKQLLYGSFEYIDFSIDDFRMNLNRQVQQRLLSKRNEIEDSLKKIGSTDKSLFDKLNTFFDKLTRLFDEISPKEDQNTNVSIEFLLNKAQIDKLSKLVEILDEYNSNVKEVFRPINKFLTIVNSFLKDTSKKLYVDEVGRLYIKKPHGRNLTVDELSSGERQLIILFANVIFNKYTLSGDRHEVLFIDEPEISLHVRWQEKFIDSLYDASEKTQFIVATHSPDIIGEYKYKTIKL